MREEEEEEVEAGFAKLQGEDFEYYMQTYSIVLGRNSKKSTVDIDLFELGGGMNISRQHARIFYDFECRRFALEIIGKNGCHVSGVHYVPGDSPVKLGSQDLLQMGDKIFYFLLPLKKTRPKSKSQDKLNSNANMTGVHVPLALPPPASALGLARKKGGRKDNEARHQNYVDFDGYGDEPPAKKGRSEGGYAMKLSLSSGSRKPYQQAIMQSSSHLPQKQGFPYHSDQKGDSRRRGDHEADTFQQKQEEQDVVSAVATLLSDICGPGEWMPVAKLHSELVEHYSGIWHQSRIRKFLSGDDRVDSESKRKPWCGLLSLLRKYPEHFVINTTSKGRVIAEFVSLVSLLS